MLQEKENNVINKNQNVTRTNIEKKAVIYYLIYKQLTKEKFNTKQLLISL